MIYSWFLRVKNSDSNLKEYKALKNACAWNTLNRFNTLILTFGLFVTYFLKLRFYVHIQNMLFRKKNEKLLF